MTGGVIITGPRNFYLCLSHVVYQSKDLVRWNKNRIKTYAWKFCPQKLQLLEFSDDVTQNDTNTARKDLRCKPEIAGLMLKYLSCKNVMGFTNQPRHKSIRRLVNSLRINGSVLLNYRWRIFTLLILDYIDFPTHGCRYKWNTFSQLLHVRWWIYVSHFSSVYISTCCSCSCWPRILNLTNFGRNIRATSFVTNPSLP